MSWSWLWPAAYCRRSSASRTWICASKHPPTSTHAGRPAPGAAGTGSALICFDIRVRVRPVGVGGLLAVHDAGDRPQHLTPAVDRRPKLGRLMRRREVDDHAELVGLGSPLPDEHAAAGPGQALALV